MAEYNLGTAKGTIEIDYKGTGSKEAEEALGKVKKSGESVDEALKKVGTGSTVAGGLVAAALGGAVKVAADFEQSLSGVQAVSGATAQEMEQVRTKALQLGADTVFGASEAALAIEELVKAGISIPDVMNGAADATVALAAAGGIELPAAAEIAANAMNQFGLSAEEMPNIADKIAGAANASAIEVGDFAHSLAQGGAVAKLAGMEFDDFALAVTAMGNAGIKGSDAGTSLKTFLMNLQPQTKKQTQLMEELGIVTEDGANAFFDATGKLKPMAEISDVLSGALEGMSDAQKTATLETLFGSDAIRAAAVIADTGADGFNELATQIGKVSAADVAATRMDNLHGSLEDMGGALETAAITIGTAFIPVLRDIADAIGNAVNWFNSLSPATQETMAKIAALVAGLLLGVGAFIKITSAVTSAMATMRVLGTALNSLKIVQTLTNLFGKLIGILIRLGAAWVVGMGPIGWIIAAVIAIGAALVVLYNKNETFRNMVQTAWAKIKEAIAVVVDWIMGTAWPALQSAWDSIAAGAQWLWDHMQTIWSAIMTAISTALNGIVSVVTTVWGWIVTAITTYINLVLTVIQTVLAVIFAVWNGFWGLFGPLISAVWDLIKAIIEVAAAWIVKIVQTYLSALLAFWTAVWNTVKSVATTVWNAIKSVVSTVANAIKSTVTTVFNAIKSVVTTVWNAIKSATTSVWNAIKSAVQGPINSAKSAVSSAVNSIKSAVSTAFNAAKSAATSAFEALRSSVVSKINAAESAVSGAVSSIKGYFSGALGWLRNAGANLIQGLINGINSKIGAVTGAISGIASKIRSFMPGSPIKEGPLKEHGWNQGRPGKQLVTLLADGIEGSVGMITRAMGDLSAASALAYSPGADLPYMDAVGSPGGTPAPSGGTVINFGNVDVDIPLDDLEDINTLREFLDRLSATVLMKNGVAA